MRGANLAGRAIDITFTTAPHALSYPVTSEYGVPHGAAVALFIAPILLYNSEVSTADCADLRGPEATKMRIDQIVQLLGCENAVAAADRLWQMLDRLQCPRRLRDVGITTPEQVQSIVGKVNAERLANNPRRIPTDALSHLMKDLL
jgi:alcohol dehydrogenase class IV